MSTRIGSGGIQVLQAKVHDRTERIRVFVRTKDGAKPAPGVPVRIVATLFDKKTKQERETPLAFLESDRYGYLSYRVGEIVRRDELRHLWLRPHDNPELQVDAFPVVDAKADPAVVTISVAQEAVTTRCCGPSLPSIPDPDPTDWRISPPSFATTESIHLGEGGCEELLHSRQSESRFRFLQLIRDDGPPASLERSEPELCEGQDEFASYQDRCFRRGAMLEYELAWIPVGHGLGRIVYSLPLAPCESVDVAVIDWQRQDTVARAEDTTVSEQLRHSQLRERDIEEAVQATLSELQSGGSFMAGTSGAGSASWGVFSLGMTGALGGAASRSRGRRRLVANTTQQVADSLAQNTSVMRRLNSTVVVQASQAEREVIQTRTVTNHNHCHALSVLYYEVLRHYLVSVRLKNWQDVLFVRYKPVNDVLSPEAYLFDEDTIFRYERILRPLLLDKSLDCGFDAIRKYLCAQALWERRPPSRPPSDNLIGTIEAVFRTGENGLYPNAANNQYVRMWLKLSGGTEVSLIPRGLHPANEPLDRVGGGRPRTSHDAIGGYTANEESSRGLFQSGQEDIVILEPADPVRWQALTGIRIRANDPGLPWDLDYLRLHTARHGLQWTMLEHESALRFTNGDRDFSLGAEEGWQSYGLAEPRDQLGAHEYCCKQGLLRHLNDNLLYYSRAIWLAQDPDERAQAFENYRVSLPVEGSSTEKLEGRLIDVIENRIVGVSGDYVAFPLPTTELADRIVQDSETKECETVISLPTRGVFAEAKLSHCNACETRDITRYWDWTESPCPEPPQIAPVEAGGHTVSPLPEATPTSLPSPVVNIVNPPSAPDPVGLAAAMKVLSTPEIFRDMSAVKELAGLLEKLTEGAVTLAKSRVGGPEATSRGGSGEPGVSETRESPQDQHDRRMVIDDAIDDAESDESLSAQEAQQLRRQQRQAMVDEAAQSGTPQRRAPRITQADEPIAVSLLSTYSNGNVLRGNYQFFVAEGSSTGPETFTLSVGTSDPRSSITRVHLPRRMCYFSCKAIIFPDEALIERVLRPELGGLAISIPIMRLLPSRREWELSRPYTISDETRNILIEITAVLANAQYEFTVHLSSGVGVEPTLEYTWSNELRAAIEGAISRLINGTLERTYQLAGNIGVNLRGEVEAGGTITGTITYQYIESVTMGVSAPPE